MSSEAQTPSQDQPQPSGEAQASSGKLGRTICYRTTIVCSFITFLAGCIVYMMAHAGNIPEALSPTGIAAMVIGGGIFITSYIYSLDNRDGEIHGNAILELSEDILLGRRSETYQMENSTSPSKDEKKTGSGQSGMVGGVGLKNQGISDKIITGQEEKEGCLYVGEHFMELLVEEFIRLVKKLANDSLHTEEKYRQSFNQKNEILDKKSKVNLEMLLRSEIIDLNLTKQMLNDVSREVREVAKQIVAYCNEKLKLKPAVKDTLRNNIVLLCKRNSALYRYLKDILEKLKEMVGGKVKTRTKESKLKKLIIEVEELMKCINEQTTAIQLCVVSSFDEKFY